MESVTLAVSGAVSINVANQSSAYVQNANAALNLAAALTTGNGAAGVADQAWVAQRCLQPSTGEEINVHTFNGSLDGCGFPLGMNTAKLFMVQNLNGTESNSLSITPESGANGWTGLFNGTITVPGGATHFDCDTGQTGYAIGASSNNLLKITNNSASAAVYYNIAFVGATA